jgi:hypothetical protein
VGYGTITASLTGDCGSVTISKEVWVGVPGRPTTNPGQPIMMAENEDLRMALASTPGVKTSESSPYWWSDGVLYPTYSQTENPCFFSASSTGYGDIYVTTENACGTGLPRVNGVIVDEEGGGIDPPYSVELYPNPASDEMQVSISENESDEFRESVTLNASSPVSYQIYDKNGFMVKTGSGYGKTFVIPLHQLSPGLHLLKLTYKEQAVELKFFKE